MEVTRSLELIFTSQYCTSFLRFYKSIKLSCHSSPDQKVGRYNYNTETSSVCVCVDLEKCRH